MSQPYKRDWGPDPTPAPQGVGPTRTLIAPDPPPRARNEAAPVADRPADAVADAVRTREAIYREYVANPAAIKMVRAAEIYPYIERSRTIEADRDRLVARVAELEGQNRWLAGQLRERESTLARAMAVIDRIEARAAR
jgi:hypothetical protein